ncbi:MAG TPA: phosphotransferase [Thermoanaerobaculia bacterium]|nr:phosphotransferase [Thermoanaerobaculia bacterium]
MSLCRLDGRFLLPPPPAGSFAHLVILGGPPGLAEAAQEAGIARQVSTALPRAGSADALFMLQGSGVAPGEAARCLAPGGCAWIEGASVPRESGLRLTGVYAVEPGFDRHAAYIPLDPPAALRWYAETLQPAWSLGKRLRRQGMRALSRWGRALSPHLAVTAVAGPVKEAPDSSLLLSHGLERAILLPFAPGETMPRAVLKVPREPRWNEKTEAEQSLLVHLHGRLDPVVRSALPEPLGLHRIGGLVVGMESYAAGRPLVLSFRSPARDLFDAADWLAAFHRQTEVRTAELDGTPFPIVLQHRDFTPWNVLRGPSGLRVIDWEGAQPGPALADLLHFATHWSELAHRATDEASRLSVFREVWIARRGGEPGEAVRRAVASYCGRLRLDRRSVPLLLVDTWEELAARRGGPEAAYAAVLAEGADRLFGGWRESGWR